MSETSGHFKRLLVSLCAGNRDESGHVNLEAARNDANALYQAGELVVGTDESTFNMILCQRNYQQLQLVRSRFFNIFAFDLLILLIHQIIEEYQKIAGCSLKDSIRKEFSGDIEVRI